MACGRDVSPPAIGSSKSTSIGQYYQGALSTASSTVKTATGATLTAAATVTAGTYSAANLAGVDTTTPEGQAFKQIMATVNWLKTVMDLARLSAAKRRQVLGGYWAGEAVTLGFALELDPAETARRNRPSYRRVPYPPHVAVVEQMLQGQPS